MSQVGVVVIGRNEGKRLIACLDSIPADTPTVYVDSGSTDGSPEAARARGATVIPLDMSVPFTAARARNAGAAALPDSCDRIQFVDGDCALRSGWLAAANAALDTHPELAAVFGRRRERHPEASRYNWLCDLEWTVPPGDVRFFGGDVLLRRTPLTEAGMYPETMIAGEEPDLAIRLRARGWRIRCLDQEMTWHDAAIARFGQWWRRAERSGHAFAELAARHPGSQLHDYDRRVRSVLFWGAAPPVIAVLLLVTAVLARSPCPMVVAGLVLALPLLQLARLVVRERRRRPAPDAMTFALFLMLAKPAQAIGVARFWRGRLGGRRSGLIEYKGSPA
jgi:glycosyltransferase involved in cell wall biosynthesis